MSNLVTPQHISNLMQTNRIVVRYYSGKKLNEKIEFSPKDLDEYLQHFINAGALATKPEED